MSLRAHSGDILASSKKLWTDWKAQRPKLTGARRCRVIHSTVTRADQWLQEQILWETWKGRKEKHLEAHHLAALTPTATGVCRLPVAVGTAGKRVRDAQSVSSICGWLYSCTPSELNLLMRQLSNRRATLIRVVRDVNHSYGPFSSC